MNCDVGNCRGDAIWYDPLLEDAYCQDCVDYLTAEFEFELGFERL